MSGGWIVLGYVVVIGLPLAVVIAVVIWPMSDTSEGRSVNEIEQRVTRELSEMETAVRPIGFPHDAPDHPLGVPEARRTMQRHRGCRVADCARKAAAWDALVAAEQIKPRTGREG
ncbi:hypothetical protein [Nocardia vinacea]|uniref:hypothetical protein n=1 Tax=Nocardia vinacea TaxID=96468 RepID=UPI0002FE4B5E|nr:hypothetical protein [Nocardia vinacea]